MAKNPPVPHVADGGGQIQYVVASVWLEPDVRIELHPQLDVAGAVITSVLQFGSGVTRADIHAKRGQLQRLHGAIGRYLEQLDQYETDLGIYHASNTERSPENQS